MDRWAALALACVIGSGCGSDPEPSDVRPRPARAAEPRSDLAERFIAKIHELDPSITVETRDPMHLVVGELEADLRNLSEECRRSPDVCDAAIDRYARFVASPRAAATRQRVRAVLLPADTVEQMRSVARASDAPDPVIGRPFVGPLWEGFVIDSDEAITHMSAQALAELGNPSLDELHELAMTNMREAFPSTLQHQPFSAEQAPNVRVVTIGDSYENSRILLHERWAEVARTVEGDLLATAPARDVVVFTWSASATDVASMRWLAQQMVQHEPHPISAAILRWTPRGWELFHANDQEDPTLEEMLRPSAAP